MHPSRRDNDLWWWFYLETRNSGSVLCSQLTSSAPQFTTLSRRPRRRLYSFDDVILHVLHPRSRLVVYSFCGGWCVMKWDVGGNKVRATGHDIPFNIPSVSLLHDYGAKESLESGISTCVSIRFSRRVSANVRPLLPIQLNHPRFFMVWR